MLRESISSVLAQDWAGETELVIVDDGSTDGTDGWLRSKGQQFRHRRIAHCGNLATVRNEGLAHASGELILFLDDDDLLEPSALRLLYTPLERDQMAGFSFGDFRYFSDEFTSMPRLRYRWQNDRDVLWNLLAGTPLHLQTTLLRRSLLDRVGDLNEALEAAEDYDLCLRASSIAQGIFVPEPVARIRRQANCMANQRALAGTANAVVAIERTRRMNSLDRSHAHVLRRNLSRLYVTLTQMYLDILDRTQARRSARRAVAINPVSIRAWVNYFKAFLTSFRPQ
jgi:glycosyltransferase involved in cell wall biosynthesis